MLHDLKLKIQFIGDSTITKNYINMNFFFKNSHITNKEADKIIERYYDGLSNLAEEKNLRSFLSQKNLPSKYAPEKALFNYFEKQKKLSTPYSINFNWIRISSVAAALILGFFIFKWIKTPHSESFALVDGIHITDKAEIKTLAILSMNSITGGDQLVNLSFENLSEINFIEQELESFRPLVDD